VDHHHLAVNANLLDITSTMSTAVLVLIRRMKEVLNFIMVTDRRKVSTVMVAAKRIERGNCAFECMANKTNILKDSVIDRTSAIDSIKKVHNALPQELITTMVDKCLERVSGIKEKPAQAKPESEAGGKGKACTPVAKHFIMCIHSQIIVNCPAEFQTDSDDCKALKTYMEKCAFNDINKDTTDAPPS